MTCGCVKVMCLASFNDVEMNTHMVFVEKLTEVKGT